MLDAIYGVRIVPESREGLQYGGFNGVIITSTVYSYNRIELVKVINTDGSHYVISSAELPVGEVLNSNQNLKKKIEILFQKAKEFAEDNEELAISDYLVSLLVG